MKDFLKKLPYIFLTVSIFFIALFLLADKNPQKIREVLLKVAPTPRDTIATPFMIDSLRKRSYEGGNITIESKAYETNTFTAYIVSYPSDGLKLFALLSVPKQKDKTFPILIMNHGYIPPEQYSTIYAYKEPFDFFASNGFVVLKPDYRANGESEGDKKDPLNRLSYPIDVLNLIASLKSLPQSPIPPNPLSPSPIPPHSQTLYLWSHSMGGDITLKVLEVAGSKVRAASLWAPVAVDYPESMLFYLRLQGAPNYEEVKNLTFKLLSNDDFKKLSPTQNVHYIQSKIILHHGKADDLVPYEWGETLAKKLSEQKIPHVFYSYEGEDHNFGRGAHQTVLNRDLEFFRSN